MSRCIAEVNSQMVIAKVLFMVILFVISVECSDTKRTVKRELHRIIIVPDRNGNSKKRPTKRNTYTHYFTRPDQQIQSTQFNNGLNQISYNNKNKLPSKNRYHEMQLPDRLLKDNFNDVSTIHVFDSKNGWRPIPGISHQHHQQHHHHPSAKYKFNPSSTADSVNNFPLLHSASTTTSKRPASKDKTNRKINRNKSRFSTTGAPKHKSFAEMIELTTMFPQPLPPVQTYLNIMTDLHQTADQSQSYLYQNVLVRPRLKLTSSTTRTPKTTNKARVTTILTTAKPYEVYENINEDFPSPVAMSGKGSGVRVQNYGKRIRPRRPTRSKITTKK